jgi:hypothetical protein
MDQWEVEFGIGMSVMTVVLLVLALFLH